MFKEKYIIAHEGLLQNTALVIADSEHAAAVIYYEVAAECGLQYGLKGNKEFTIARVTEHDNLPRMLERTLFHWDDMQGFRRDWLQHVEGISGWIKYGWRAMVDGQYDPAAR